ncbi:MAG: hypothetical protein ACPIOQ_08130, partial [Promethearchaeia archaeon]
MPVPGAGLPPAQAEIESAASKAAVFSLSLPSKDSTSVVEAERAGGGEADKDKKRNKEKAARILSTQHNVPAEEEAARGVCVCGCWFLCVRRVRASEHACMHSRPLHQP